MEEESGEETWKPVEKRVCPVTTSPSRSPPSALPLQFTRGSYRKYMNQLIRGNSDTEISNEKIFLGDRVRPHSAVFGQSVLSAVPRYVTEVGGSLEHKSDDGSTDTLHNSEENVFASASSGNVFSPVRRAVCSWNGSRESADMTASTETLVGSDDCALAPGCASVVSQCECGRECACECGGKRSGSPRQRRTGAITTRASPSRVEALIHKYSELIRQHMEKCAAKPQRKIVRSSLPNLETGKIDSIRKEKHRKLRKFSLTLEKDMGTSQSAVAGNSPTYLALPPARKHKRKSSTSPSSVSDEGCSVAAAGSSETPESPVSSEDGGWPGDTLKRCTSSDSAVECVDGSEDDDRPRTTNNLSLENLPLSRDPGKSRTFLLDEVNPVQSERSEIELRSDRWFIEHYGSSVLEKLHERSRSESWVADMGEVNLDRRMSEVDSVEGIDPGTERRESNLSCFTDDDEHPGYRYFRTPSVVVSDHSDDPAFASSSITLEEIERFRQEYAERQNSIGDSSSDCSLTSSWSNVYSTISALDAEFVLRTPERKASDCSSCSTLSGDEEPSCEQILQDVKTHSKVGLIMHIVKGLVYSSIILLVILC